MKGTLFIFLLTLATMFSFSQMTIKPGLGLNVTGMTVTNGTATSKADGLVGASIMFGERRFYFEPGIFWVWKSSHVTGNNSTTSEDFSTSLGGVRIPVTIGYHLPLSVGSKIGLRVFTGVSDFFITNTSADVSQLDINKSNWSWHAGAGIDIYRFYLDASYEWCLTSLQSASQATNGIQLGKTHTLYIVVGFNIRL